MADPHGLLGLQTSLIENNTSVLNAINDLSKSLRFMSVRDISTDKRLVSKCKEMDDFISTQNNKLQNIKSLKSEVSPTLTMPTFGNKSKYRLEHAILSVKKRFDGTTDLSRFWHKFCNFVKRQKLTEPASINLLLDLCLGEPYDYIYEKSDKLLDLGTILQNKYGSDDNSLSANLHKLRNFSPPSGAKISTIMAKYSDLVNKTRFIAPLSTQSYRKDSLLKQGLLSFASKKAREEMRTHINSSVKAGIVPTYQILFEIAKSHETPFTEVTEQQSDNEYTSYPTALKSEIHPNKLDSGYGYDSECEDYYYQDDDYDDYDQQDPLDEVTRKRNEIEKDFEYFKLKYGKHINFHRYPHIYQKIDIHEDAEPIRQLIHV